jgi:hypothetical protein
MTNFKSSSKHIDVKVHPIKKEINGKLYQSLYCILPKPYATKLGIETRDTVRFSLSKNKINLEKVQVG